MDCLTEGTAVGNGPGSYQLVIDAAQVLEVVDDRHERQRHAGDDLRDGDRNVEPTRQRLDERGNEEQPENDLEFVARVSLGRSWFSMFRERHVIPHSKHRKPAATER